MVLKSTSVAGAIALALCAAATQAADIGDMFSVRGYGSLGAAYTSEKNADFVSNVLTQHEGIGHSGSASAALDSRTALQIDARFTDRLSGVVQLVSESHQNNSWDDQ